MEKKHGALIFGLIVSAAMAAISLLAAPHIPAGAEVATHFDISGKPDGWMSRPMALVFYPLLALGLTLVFALARAIRFSGDPQHDGARRALDISGMAAVTLIAAVQVLTLLHAQGKVTDIPGAVIPLAGLFLMVVGNLLGKTGRNTLVGVRTPWSLASPYAWEKSNRMAGRMMVALGLLVMLVSFGGFRAAATWLLLGGALLLAILSSALSWHYWRTDPARNPSN